VVWMPEPQMCGIEHCPYEFSFGQTATTKRPTERSRHDPSLRHRPVCAIVLGRDHPGKSLICEIVKLLPFEEGSFQYRVRSADEKHDRTASESSLTLVANGNGLRNKRPMQQHAINRDIQNRDIQNRDIQRKLHQ
jgi:hypothetical protein